MRTLALLALAASAAAHDPGLSGLQVDLAGERIGVTLTLAAADFAASLGRGADRDGDGQISAAALAAMPLAERAPGWIALSSDGVAVPLALVSGAREADGDVVVALAARWPAGQRLSVQMTAFPSLPLGHRQFATLSQDGRTLSERLLSAHEPTLQATLGAPAATSRLLEFLALGVEHVLTGYDHVLFLLGVLLAVRSLRQALGVVTAFTVAHSLTLVLAALGIARAPGALVECAIALSVAGVGASLLLRQTPRASARATFAFGLVHGFGFAACLGDLSGGGHALPLFGFNLGVECGQLGLVALTLPLLLLWQRRAPHGFVRMRRLLAAGLVLCGGLWLLERCPDLTLA